MQKSHHNIEPILGKLIDGMFMEQISTVLSENLVPNMMYSYLIDFEKR
ncbi:MULTISPECIES: hypothetical protein [Vibrio]|nr:MULTISPECIES: hypothetical protein [Vibrio]MDW1944609.1 hypothetical protein [Vibrio sp. Vb0599]MBO0200515.1 hypothetical protein [Vibrio alginolyticus]MBS9970282.1 hypothetical protein [Vibrio alginolyticus]MCR9642414.1 hypothetical protein [Vibrio alginolyticus]MDW1580716.1 hypothetical protein [Vibrio sp. Vb2897]